MKGRREKEAVKYDFALGSLPFLPSPVAASARFAGFNRMATMNEKASVSKELNAKHRKVCCIFLYLFFSMIEVSSVVLHHNFAL